MEEIIICDKCVFLEEFGDKEKDEFFNKCALLDIFNIEECIQCDSFKEEPEEIE